MNFLGTPETLSALTPFLKSKSDNPRATILALYAQYARNDPVCNPSIAEARTRIVEVQKFFPNADFDSLSPMRIRDLERDPDFLKIPSYLAMMVGFDDVFENYLEAIDMKNIAQKLGLNVKDETTVNTAWPLRLESKSSPYKHDLLLASGHVGSERYVEWDRV